MIQEGARLADVAVAHPVAYVLHGRGLERLVNTLDRPKPRMVCTWVLWGPTGTGKSTWVFEHLKSLYKPLVQRGSLWFENYQGQKTLFLDDVVHRLTCEEIMELTDRWPLTLAVKGSSVTAHWNFVMICSNLAPQNWFPNVQPELRDAMLRRLNVVHYVADRSALAGIEVPITVE